MVCARDIQPYITRPLRPSYVRALHLGRLAAGEMGVRGGWALLFRRVLCLPVNGGPRGAQWQQLVASESPPRVPLPRSLFLFSCLLLFLFLLLVFILLLPQSTWSILPPLSLHCLGRRITSPLSTQYIISFSPNQCSSLTHYISLSLHPVTIPGLHPSHHHLFTHHSTFVHLTPLGLPGC